MFKRKELQTPGMIRNDAEVRKRERERERERERRGRNRVMMK